MVWARRCKAVLALGALSLLVSACGHYKSDFGCKGYPESSLCLSTSEVYKRRHEQLSTMKPDDSVEESSIGGEAAMERVSSVAGLAEMHLGQPNISAPKVMQVWIAPWRDRNNFLHESSIVYAIVEQSDWTYGRAPKGVSGGVGDSHIFTPRMTPGMVEQGGDSTRRAGTGGQPIFATPPTPPSPVTPHPSSQFRPPLPSGAPSAVIANPNDPSAILRQLQEQVPSMGGVDGVPREDGRSVSDNE